MKDAKDYLETKKLMLSKDMSGYIIPYSYLVTMLNEFSNQQIKKLNK